MQNYNTGKGKLTHLSTQKGPPPSAAPPPATRQAGSKSNQQTTSWQRLKPPGHFLPVTVSGHRCRGPMVFLSVCQICKLHHDMYLWTTMTHTCEQSQYTHRHDRGKSNTNICLCLEEPGQNVNIAVNKSAVINNLSSHLIYPLTVRAVGAPQMISQAVSSIFSLFFHCPMGLGKLQACPFHGVVFPPLLLSALSSFPFTVRCEMVLATPNEQATCPYHCS